MYYLKTLLIPLFLFYSVILFAQFPIQGDYQSIFLNETPDLPNYQEFIADNSVPSPMQITRISDYYEPWDWYPIIEYAKIQTWNADQTAYKIRSVWVYDAETHQIINNLPSGDLYPAYWSNINSDLIFSFRENGDIKTYSLSTETITTVHSIVGYDVIKLGPGEGNIDKNDKYVALVGKRNTDLDVIIYDLELNQVIHTEIFAGAWGNGQDWSPEYIDWISVSQSGDYVGIMWNHTTTSSANTFNGHFGVEIFNTIDMNYLRRIADYGNHGDFGYAVDGDEVFVQFWGPNTTDYVNMYYLNRMERITIATHPDFDAAGHISCRNINRPGWTYLTQTDAAQSGQIVALKLDDSGIVEHFGHHFSSSTTYDKVPMAVPSPNGDKVMFKSDFGDAANTDLVYVFQSKVYGVILGVNNFQVNNLNIYPNPTENNLFIEMKSLINTIFIYNSLGQKIITISDVNNLTYNLNTENLYAGTYFIRLETRNSQIYTKLFLKK